MVFFKKDIHKNFAIFAGKRLCWSLFAGLHVCNFICNCMVRSIQAGRGEISSQQTGIMQSPPKTVFRISFATLHIAFKSRSVLKFSATWLIVSDWGVDYMIPVYRDEISPHPAERVHNLQLHAEIRLCPGKDFYQFKDTLSSPR